MVKKTIALRAILLLLSHITCLCSYSETVLRGIVVDNQKQPVFAANVFLQSNQSVGTVTDLEGSFTLTVNNENDSLIISSIGYYTRKLQISDLNVKEVIHIVLYENTNLLSEIVIKAEDPISQRFAVTKMTGFDIYMSPLSQGDPLKAITILPNSTATDESANPALRGSSGSSSIVTLNGVPVYNPVRSGDLNSQGFFSLFNPEIVDNQYIYASNPPLTYGNTTAGLVEIQTNKVTSNNQVQLSTSLGNLGALLTTNFKGNKSSIQVYYNHQFSDLFVGIQKRYYPNIKEFSTDDAGLNFYQRIGKNLEWKSYHYLIHEKYAGYNEDYTYRGEIKTSNDRYFTVNTLKYFKNKISFTLNNGYNYSNSNYKFGNTYSRNRNNQSYTSINLKTYPFPELEIQSGASFDYNQNKYNDIIPVYYYAQQPTSPSYSLDTILANKILEAYGYLNWNISGKLSMSTGLRTNISLGSQRNYWSYQLGINYSPSKYHTFIIGSGKYHNYLLPTFYTKKYTLLSSYQLSIDYSYTRKNSTIKAASYYKEQQGDQTSNTIYNLAYSKIQTFGIEFTYEQEFMKYFKFTFSNAFTNQNLHIGSKRYSGPYDLNYFIKSIIEYNNPNLFSISLSYIGRPGTYYHTIKNAQYNDKLDVFMPIFENDLYSSQYTNYNRVDLTVNKYMTFKKVALAAFLSINNLFDIKNQMKDNYNYNYTQKSYDYYQRRSIYFGGVWYFSI